MVFVQALIISPPINFIVLYLLHFKQVEKQ